MPQRLRIFISSPSDVNPERRRAALTIEKLAKDYARHFEISFVLWESEPMLASGHFQDTIVPPSDTDIVVLILWSRLGTPLPAKTAKRAYCGIDGRTPVTGTEWEFEDALRGCAQNGVPDILAYKKKALPKAEYKSAADLEELGRQLQKLEWFWRKHFVDSGQFLAGFFEFDDLESFDKKLDGDLRHLIEHRIAARDEKSGKTSSAVERMGSPFRGLETYRFEHASIFFGRSNATRTAIEQLVDNADAGRPFLLILGASGAGKSSLAQAGIVPALMVRGVVPGVGAWRRAVMRPGGHPDGVFAALAAALTAEDGLPELLAGQDVAALAKHLAAAAADPAFPIVSALRAREAAARNAGDLLSHEQMKLVLLVDQLEELITHGELAAQRNAFTLCLQGLVGSGSVFVLATMRSDYWHRAADVPLLVGLAEGRARLDLLPATQAEIAEMIRRPAEAAGLTFDTDPRTEIRLDAALAEESSQEPGALPLLSFLLDALYAKDVVEDKHATLSYRSMRALGGLKGAIARRAEAAFATLPEDVQAALPKILRALVTVSRSGAEPTAREAPMSRFPDESPERRIVEALLAPDMRLLVAEGDGEGARVRVAHEALITHWERAKRHIAQDRDDLRTRAAVEEAEAEWRSANYRQRRGYLLRDPQLANAVDLARRWRDELSADIANFVAQSDAAAKAQRRRAAAVSAFVILCLAALTTASFWALYIAETQRNEVLIGQSRFLASDARAATAAGDATLSTLLALAALPQSLDRPDRPLVGDAEYALEDAFTNRRERFVLSGHQEAVNCIAFSPDGVRVVTASDDKSARIWDVKTGAVVVELKGHERNVNSAAFSQDGTSVLTASDDRTARIWDAKTGAMTGLLTGHERDVRSAVFSPDGMRVLTASWDGTARLWKKDGTLILTLRGDGKSISSAAFSPDGMHVAAATTENVGWLWDLETGALTAVLKGHEGSLTAASFSPDGKRVLTASFDGTARLWDAKTGVQIFEFRGHENRVNAAAFSPDGALVVTASGDRTARLWDTATGKSLAVLRGHDGEVISAGFSADGTRVVTTSDDRTARIWDARIGNVVAAWDAKTGTALAVLRGHEKDVALAVFSPDGRQVATASVDGSARLWDVKTSAERATLDGHDAEVKAAAFSPDGTRVVTAGADKTARLWDTRTGARIAVLGHDNAVVDAAFSPDGKRVVTASWDMTARLWDAETGREIAVLRGHQDLVTSASFSPDGLLVVTASPDATARIWDGRTGAELKVLRGHETRVNAAAFSPDGKRVVTASDDMSVRVWDVSSGLPILVLKGHEDAVKSVHYSPDGMRLVSGSSDRTARLWDAVIGVPIAVLKGHGEIVTSTAFSPDGSRIVTASWDLTAGLWNGRTGAPIATLRGHELQVASAAFSPDGTRIITASWDRTARLWDGRTGAEGAVLRGHERPVTSAAFSADSASIVTASDDKTARIWRAPPRCRTLMEAARKGVPRQLSEQQRYRYFLAARSDDESLGLYGRIRPWLGRLLRDPDKICSGAP